jgi:Replication-relaxation
MRSRRGMTSTETTPPVTRSRMVLTPRDAQLLDYVYRFRLLSRDQAMAVAPFRSLTRANTRLAALVRARFLSRKQLPIYPGHGGAQALYFPGSASPSALTMDPTTLTRTVRQIARWDLRQTAHVVAANQVLVDLLVALRTKLEAELLTFRTEPELRQMFSDRELVPDGWIAWAEHGKRFNSFVEIDLHHEGLTEWRTKILHYQTYLQSGLHQERFHFQACRVLVLVKTRARLDHLRQCAQVCGRLFLFGELGQVTAQNILDTVWLPASGQSRRALRDA